jgi:hypothetical protein
MYGALRLPQPCRHLCEKKMVWCTISSAGIVGPVSLDDTVNAEHYLKLFKTSPQRIQVHVVETFFQKDGSRPHI